GGGAMGLLAARAFSDTGRRVTIVEAGDLFGQQSGHSHGYLHQGYIYLNPNDRVVDELVPSAKAWEDLALAKQLDFESSQSLIALPSTADAKLALDSWDAKLRGHRLLDDALDGENIPSTVLGGGSWKFVLSQERVLNFSELAKRIIASDL